MFHLRYLPMPRDFIKNNGEAALLVHVVQVAVHSTVTVLSKAYNFWESTEITLRKAASEGPHHSWYFS